MMDKRFHMHVVDVIFDLSEHLVTHSDSHLFHMMQTLVDGFDVFVVKTHRQSVLDGS